MSPLPSETINRNLHLLAEEWGAIAQKIHRGPPHEEVQLVPAQDGSFACRLNVRGRPSWVHHPAAAKQEAILPIREFQPQPGALVIVWQAGLGYLPAELRDLRATGSLRFRLIIVENRDSVFRASLQTTDYYGLFNSRSTYFFVGANSEEQLVSFLKRYPWLLKNGVVALPGSRFPNSDRELAQIRSRVESIRRDAAHELESLHTQSRTRVLNPLAVVSAGLYPAHAERLCAAFLRHGWTASKRLEPSSLTRFIEDPDSFLDLCREGLPKLVLCFGGKSDLSMEDLRQLRRRGTKLAAWFYDNPFRFPLADEELSLLDAVFVFDRYYESFFAQRGAPLCRTLPAATGVPRTDQPPPESYDEEVAFLGSTGIERVMRYSRDIPSDAGQLTHLSQQVVNQLLERTDEERHREMERIAGYDASMGSMLRLLLLEEFLSYRIRVRFLSAISDLPLAVYGDCHWANKQAVGDLTECFRGRGARFPDETVELYRTSKINVNIFHAQCVDSITTRVYDTLAVGGFLLSEYRPNLEREFEIGKDLDVFHTPEELREKVKYYLANDGERRRIAIQGQETARRSATYEKRVNTLLECMRLA